MFFKDIINSITPFLENKKTMVLLLACKEFWNQRAQIDFWEIYFKSEKERIPGRKKVYIEEGDLVLGEGGFEIPLSVKKVSFRASRFYLNESPGNFLIKEPCEGSYSVVLICGLARRFTLPPHIETLELLDCQWPKKFEIPKVKELKIRPGFFVWSKDPEYVYPENLESLDIVTGGLWYIPPVKKLTILISSNKTIQKGYIPSSVEILDFGLSTITFGKESIPNSVRVLKMGKNFNSDIENLIPDSVEDLTFGFSFNHSVSGKLPKGLKRLEFGFSYNKPIKDLPEGLETLIFGYSFDQSVELPPSLKTLIFGVAYNKPVKKLPKGIEYLVFGWNFDQPIEGEIPDSVISLEFGEEFDQPKITIPSSVRFLIFKNWDCYKLLDQIPDTVQYLSFGKGNTRKVRTAGKWEFFNDPLGRG